MNVHLVGGDPWGYQLIGPALLAVTAIIAAWIAARTANHRQQEQLAHDRTLQAEQLAHDRELREQARTADAVDDVILGAFEAIKKRADYQAAVENDALRQSFQTAEAKAAEVQRLGGLNNAVFLAMSAMSANDLPLRLRLGPDHPVVLSHGAYCNAISKHRKLLSQLHERSPDADDRSKIDAADQAVVVTLTNLEVECRKWVESSQARVGSR